MERHTATLDRRRKHARAYRLYRALLAALLVSIAPLLALSPNTGLAQEVPPPAATPVPRGTKPDACEPNDSLVAPCALQTEIDQTDLNFVDGTIDVYSFLFKGGRVYSISASSDDGIDPAIRVFLAGQVDTPVAENDDAASGSPNAAVQVAVTDGGWYIVEVANRAPGSMRGKTYALAARSSAAPPAAAAAQAPDATGDMLENNYDVTHAARIAWGVPYDLSLACPDPRPGACYAGDHDFLLLPVKRGIPLVALSYDLGPGADTILTLYRPDATQTSAGSGDIAGWSAVAGNDDIAPGRTLRSQILFTPNWDGDALLVVAQSERRTPPSVPATLGPAGRYRLMAGSPGMEALQSVLRAQSDLAPAAAATARPPNAGAVDQPAAPRPTAQPEMRTPQPATPTPAPLSVSAPAPGSAAQDAEEIIKEACTTGPAVVKRPDTPFYSAANPATERRLLTTYPEGARVTLLGSCYIGWVKAQPEGSVTPGWMFGPDLALAEIAETATSSGAADDLRPTNSGAGATAPTAAAKPEAATSVRVVRVAATPPPAPIPPRRQALTIAVRVLDRDGRGLAGVKLNLVDTFGHALIDAVTPAGGNVTFTPDLAPNTAVSVRIPAAGVLAPVDPTDPTLVITLPQGGA